LMEPTEPFWPIWDNDGQKPELGFSHVILASTVLPLRNSKATSYKKTNGRARLVLRTTPRDDDHDDEEVYLPYGPKARLLLLYAMSECKRTNSPVVEIGSSFSDFCSRAGLKPHGRNIKTLQEQLYRLSQTYVKVRVPVGFRGEDEARAFLFSKIRLYREGDKRQGMLWPQQLTFHHDIAESIITHSFPVDMKALRNITHSARGIDIFLWLSHRLYRLNKTTTVPWKSLLQQFAKDGAHLGSFRGRFREALELVLERAYPAANVELTEAGLILKESPLAVPKKKSFYFKGVG